MFSTVFEGCQNCFYHNLNLQLYIQKGYNPIFDLLTKKFCNTL